MMNTRSYFFIFVLASIYLGNTSKVFAQIDPTATGYYIDALRYSQTKQGGTARTLSLGGVQAALGADMSAMSGNPAGLGLYRKSEISLSPTLNFANTSSEYLGSSLDDNRATLSFSNFGAVFANPKSDVESGPWRGGAFGISYTKINNFQNRFSYEGTNTSNSITDFFAENANGTPTSDFDAQPADELTSLGGLAYWTFLINPDQNDNALYHSALRDENNALINSVKQEEIVTTSGGQNQWNFAYGGNFNDKLFLGASVGLVYTNYRTQREFRETSLGDDPNKELSTLSITDTYKVLGTGLNLSLGAIYKINDLARIGLSAATPTFHSMTESFSTTMSSTFVGNNPGSYDAQTLPGEFKYSLITPFKATLGGAFFLGKNGFISADVDYVAYNTASLTSDNSGFTFNGDNKTIKNIYKPTLNYKIGAEFRQGLFAARGGFAYYGDPFEEGIDKLNRSVMNISGGIGIRTPGFHVDLGIIHSSFQSGYNPYTLADNSHSSVVTKNRIVNGVITVGFNF